MVDLACNKWVAVAPFKNGDLLLRVGIASDPEYLQCSFLKNLTLEKKTELNGNRGNLSTEPVGFKLLLCEVQHPGTENCFPRKSSICGKHQICTP